MYVLWGMFLALIVLKTPFIFSIRSSITLLNQLEFLRTKNTIF